MSLMTALEMASYLVTILGLPLAITVFVIQQREQRQNEQSALHRMLSEEYDNFLKLALDNADLHLIAGQRKGKLTREQHERQLILFNILISLFEKAFIIIHDKKMTRDTRRMWASWEDDIHDWLAKPEFRDRLPELLRGEDSEFADYVRSLATGTSK